MNKLNFLAEFLTNFRNIYKCNYKEIEEFSNIRDEIEKLIESECRNNCNGSGMHGLINIFVNTVRREELVICLSTAASVEDFDCCDEEQMRKLLKWLKGFEEEEANPKYIVGLLHLYSNIIKSNIIYADDIVQIVFTKKNLNSFIECFTNVQNDEFENVAEILHYYDALIGCVLDKTDLTLFEESLDTLGKSILNMHYGNSFHRANIDLKDKIIFLSISLLCKITSVPVAFATKYVSELLGLIRAYWQYNPDLSTNLTKVLPSQHYFDDVESEIETVPMTKNPGCKITKKKKPKTVAKMHQQNFSEKQNASNSENLFKTLDLKTSESETSENEVGGSRANTIKLHRLIKIRLYSILLLGKVMAAQQPKTLFSFWHAIYPNASFKSNVNLLSIGRTDTNVRCRSAALQVAGQLLYCSKPFLRQAESINKPSNYLSFTASIALDVILLYESLLKIVKDETFLPVIVQALKCLAFLIQATSFEKLEPGLAMEVIENVHLLIKHRDTSIQVASLMVMEFIISSNKLILEICDSIGFPSNVESEIDQFWNESTNSFEELEVLTDEEDASKDLCSSMEKYLETSQLNVDVSICKEKKSFWLLKRLLINLSSNQEINKESSASASVKIGSLQVMIAIAPHLHLFYNFLEDIAEVLIHCINDPFLDIKLHAARCTDSLAYQISQIIAEKSLEHKTIYSGKFKAFWARMLPVLKNCVAELKDQGSTLKVAICDAISNMGEIIYECQLHIVQLNLINFLSGIAIHEDSVVSAAAIRALAIFAQFASLRRDLVFIENIAELSLRLRKDSNLLVRIKATWSLANISDALVYNEISQVGQKERISDDLLFRLLEVTLEDCSGNDKIRCNAVRCLGNLVHLVSSTNLENMEWKKLVRMCIEKLTESIQSSGNAKVKWNSCYAIRNLICNRNIFHSDLCWQESLYSTLCSTIVYHQNFKVRINATMVILNIREREHFGSFYETFWNAVLTAIEESYHLDNYYEYNHRDQLQEQLCLAVAHLINIRSTDDLPIIVKNLTLHRDVFRETWTRVINRIIPEKAAPLLLCVERLQKTLENDLESSLRSLNYVKLIVSAFQMQEEYTQLTKSTIP